MFHGFRDVLKEQGLMQATIALEKNFFDAALYEVFKAHILPNATVVSATPVLSRLRMLKEPEEIECLRVAAGVADKGMAAAARAALMGVRETDVAGEAEYVMRKAGAEGWASATYVASGWRSAMAHGPASSKIIEAGDVVQIHLAPIVGGYTTDLCRTILVGRAPEEAAGALDAYLAAQEAGIAAATPSCTQSVRTPRARATSTNEWPTHHRSLPTTTRSGASASIQAETASRCGTSSLPGASGPLAKVSPTGDGTCSAPK